MTKLPKLEVKGLRWDVRNLVMFEIIEFHRV